MLVTDKYIFFYKEWPGNYTKTNFNWNYNDKVNNFFCTEQAFMYAKAITFNDISISDQILKCNNPNACRLLGRKVSNYNDSIWNEKRYNIMYDCNFAKYSQDNNLQKLLLDSKFDNLIFVEASPIDRIWGIGMDENNRFINNKYTWKGKNLLGEILTNIRKDLLDGKRYKIR